MDESWAMGDEPSGRDGLDPRRGGREVENKERK